ncbi:hypothetical protein Aple_052600 [Acrocarpospora pleiomorpha]|uniref:Uncharacterized protein n=1 Tax=Acrocarpospora pleiomorpha TaxID=90975 RepID=A0A5M3XSW6_9ACTN|nr:hypothetical protein [Acrocarpospora pleiomorpha]GES22363.1 hypothetical protein Aple_052600 [Acrocarpospora pleiomorpha]
MAKLDGMDPKLVRELLAQITRAGEQMDLVEAKVAQFTRTAGVPIRPTHRPSQVADAGATMVRDVSARLALLEKREKQDPPPRPSTDEKPSNPSGGPSTDTTQPAEDPKPSKPASDGPPEKPDSKDEPEKPPTKGESEQPPPSKGESEQPPPSKGESEQPPPSKGEDERPVEPKQPCDDDSQVDTPRKDHRDDIDQTGGRQVIIVDGVKVVSTPLNQPSDAYLAWLSEHMQEIQPIDTPNTLDGVYITNGDGPQPQGPAGLVQPMEPTIPFDPPQPGLAPGDPMGEYIGTPADNLTEEPPYSPSGPDNSSGSANPAGLTNPGLAPGDPMGDYIGTPADNLTEEPPSRADSSSGTADNLTEAPSGSPDIIGPTAPLGQGEPSAIGAGGDLPAQNPGPSQDTPTQDSPRGQDQPPVQDQPRGQDQPPTQDYGRGQDQPPAQDSPRGQDQPPAQDQPRGQDQPPVQDSPRDQDSPSAQNPPARDGDDCPSPGTSERPGTSENTASGNYGSNGSGATIDPRTLAAQQPGDVLSVPAGQLDDDALRALIALHENIGPMDMPSISGNEWAGSLNPEPTLLIGSAEEIDPRALAAQQPGDVLSAPANPPTDDALRALIQLHGEIEPMDMPSVSVPAGEWGTGEWAPMTIEPDGPAGSVGPNDPDQPIPAPGA